MSAKRKSAGDRATDGIIAAGMLLVMAVTLYPFVYVLSMSISEPFYVVNQSVWLYPKGFSLQAYNIVFQNPDIWTAYMNTFFYTSVGTLLNIAMTILAAYPLARRSFFIRRPLIIFIVVTMFFSGGLIPSFLLIQELGLYNTRLAILLPTAVNAFLIVIAKTFFQSISESLHESAKLDGAGEFVIMVRIIVPLSMPIVAVLALFYAVEHWNSYFAAMIYLPNPQLQPLSLYLVKVLVQHSNNMLQNVMNPSDRAMYAVQLKYALIIIAVVPILLIYPFLQKYFVRGVMIGSLKE